VGAQLLDRYGGWPWSGRADGRSRSAERLIVLAEALLSHRGEASGMAMSERLLADYAALTPAQRRAFFEALDTRFRLDRQALAAAWAAYEAKGDEAAEGRLIRACEPQRQELLRRLNLAPGGTGRIVAMREDLLALKGGAPKLVDQDFVHVLNSWFNPGFLSMERITWTSPADLLERIIRYEAVHSINGWEDLRRRVQPDDRRCYGFFHPSLPGEPLIFVEVALMQGTPASIEAVLHDGQGGALAAEEATTAVFYSISNCQPGLRGVSFGSFLIKQVAADLSRELPNLKTFVTLSPAPGFADWVEAQAADPSSRWLSAAMRETLAARLADGWQADETAAAALKPVLMQLAAAYFLEARNQRGQPADPVARFHLGNGARLERLNWLGDKSAKGLAESFGLMVNYGYRLDTIEANHEAFVSRGEIVAAPGIAPAKRRTEAAA
jgi:malonyl-CoA decarboxylase